MHTNHIYDAKFTIRSYEVGVNQKTTICTIADLFQEAAGLHAKKLNFDITDLHNLGLTWILYKMHIKVNAFPKRWDEVWVKTWPSTGNDIRAFRTYELRSKSGNKLAEALGQWMILDLEKRRPRKIPQMLARFPLLSESDNELSSNKSQIEPINNKSKEMVTTVGKHDLDMNNHVNSVKYIEWSTGHGIESPDLQCEEIVIQHQAEAYYGDKIYRASSNEKVEQKITLYRENGAPISTAIARFI